MKEIPKKYLARHQADVLRDGEPPSPPSSRLGRLRESLKPPAVRATERVVKRDGVSYSFNENGEIVQTTVVRGTVLPVMAGFTLMGGGN